MNDQEVIDYISRPVREWDKKPLICVPFERTLPAPDKVLPSLFHYARQGCDYLFLPYSRTDVTRNKAAFGLLANEDYEWILFLDSDHYHDPQIVEKLCRWSLRDPGIRVIGGLNFARKPPYAPCFAFKTGEDRQVPISWPDDIIFEVEMVGSGSLLIHRSVFIDLMPPYFEYKYDGVWRDEWPGEEIEFCKKCKEAGIKMWVDPSVRSPHISEIEIGEENFRQWFAERGMSGE